MRHITSDERIIYLSHFNKKSIAIFHSNIAKEYYKSLEAKVASLSFGVVQAAISSNRINITENNWEDIYEQKLYESHKYILETNHAYSGNVPVMDEMVVKQMSADVKTIFENLVKQSIWYSNDFIRERNNQYRRIILQNNKNVMHELSASERYSWIETAREIWPLYENEIGSQLIDEAASHR